MDVSRRAFLGTGVAALAAQDGLDSLRELVSQGDLVYEKPVARSEEGLPVGNGRMGTLVWTTPASLRMQINHVDLYANGCATNSFIERHNDYCGGCGFVDIDFGGVVFPESGFRQRLSIYEGFASVGAVNIAAWTEKDCIAVDLGGRRAEVGLRLLRFESKYGGNKAEANELGHVTVTTTRSHTATSQLIVQGNWIALTQEFREGGFYCKSAVVVGGGSRARFANEMEVRLTAGAEVLIGSAASFDPAADVVALALAQVDGATYARVAAENRQWWHQFWERGHLQLSSKDGSAEYVAANYHYHLYLMGATSRGKYPAKFNGMLWNTNGDQRTWGAQHWFANLSCNYEALFATNRMELLEPMFQMYFGMREAAAVAARQQWGSEGIFIPETVYFDGLEKLPDDIASEMRQLYLLKKPWEQRSAKFREFASHKHPHSSRWNWILKAEWVDGRFVETERGSGPYGNVSHILGSNAKVAYWFWRRYEYTLDVEWLREQGYPMLRGAAEFYRNYPNVSKGEDGRYHIYHVNSNESVWGAQDTDEDLSAMRGLFPAVLKASEILNIDAEMRPVWRDFLEHLAPLPLSSDTQALKPAGYAGPVAFVRGLKPAVKEAGFLPDGNSLPMWFFDLCSVESSDKARLAIANATFEGMFRDGMPVSLLSKVPIAAASLGRREEFRQLVVAQMNGPALRNRLGLREGPNALDSERLGRASEALQLALLQSTPPSPGEAPVIHLFPAWPEDWDGEFRLLARGGFVVNAAIAGGTVKPVELLSQAGASCTVRNPWGTRTVTLTRDGKTAEVLIGPLIRFDTRKGEKIRLT